MVAVECFGDENISVRKNAISSTQGGSGCTCCFLKNNIMFTFKLVYSDLFPPLKNVSKQERYNSFRFEYIIYFSFAKSVLLEKGVLVHTLPTLPVC